MIQIWCNGQWLPAGNYPGTAQDRGAFLGLGLFESMLAIDGIAVFPERHLSRLRHSGGKLGWSIEIPGFSAIVAELLVRNGLATGLARIRLIVTAGSGPNNDLAAGADRLIWMAAFPTSEVPTSLAVCLSPWPRNERSPLAGLKTACYAENLIALDHARRLGFEEAIFLNTAGHLCEAATANLFLVKNGVLLTPSLDSGCLPGIAREVLLELAVGHNIPTEERTLTLDDLHVADEIFLSSSTRGVIRVVRVSARRLEPGPLAPILLDAWRAAVSLR